jgi:rRNA maturation endonuclease Nob1
MSLLSDVTEKLSSGDGGDDGAETFAYRCVNCEARFETPKTRMLSVNCPDCGSMDVRPDD